MKKKLKKKRKLPKSPLKMVFKILAHINKDNSEVVKYTFDKEIHKKLIDYLGISSTSYELTEVYSFLCETLPQVYPGITEEGI